MVIVQRKIVGGALQHSKRPPGRHINDARHPLRFGGKEFVRRADEINCENIGGGPAAVAGDCRRYARWRPRRVAARDTAAALRMSSPVLKSKPRTS